jgi:hypothetical protein
MSNVMALQAKKVTRPNTENRKVLPKRGRNADVRPREYLTPDEVERLVDQAGKLGRYGARDAALLLLAYRHGLRVSELVALRWDMVDLKQGLLHVNRLKNGIPSVHRHGGDPARSVLTIPPRHFRNDLGVTDVERQSAARAITRLDPHLADLPPVPVGLVALQPCIFPERHRREVLLRALAEGLAFLRRVDAVDADLYLLAPGQNRDRVAIGDPDDAGAADFSVRRYRG